MKKTINFLIKKLGYIPVSEQRKFIVTETTGPFEVKIINMDSNSFDERLGITKERFEQLLRHGKDGIASATITKPCDCGGDHMTKGVDITIAMEYASRFCYHQNELAAMVKVLPEIIGDQQRQHMAEEVKFHIDKLFKK